MKFQRIQLHELPDGTICRVYPFHICMEGLKNTLLCRDDEDYDVLQKTIHVCCHVNNVIVVEEIEMSTHCHVAVLAENQAAADNAGEAVKKNYSQYLSHKYGERNTLAGSNVKAIYLDSDSYLRNALAYIPRNALDTGASIEDYRWSSYKGMFASGKPDGRKVSAMTRREKEALFHTHADLSGVPWLVDNTGALIPSSSCDHRYLENAFCNDQAFFLRIIGSVSCAEMAQKLVHSSRQMLNDTEFKKLVSEKALGWFGAGISEITQEKKIRLVTYFYHTQKTTPAQLARCVGLAPDRVARILKDEHRGTSSGEEKGFVGAGPKIEGAHVGAGR